MPGGGLEGVRDGEQVPVGPAAADELQAHGQPPGVKPAGTLMAGRPVIEIRYAEAIQSR